MECTRFEKPVLKSLRMDMDAALKVIADKYGIVIETGNATYSDNKATFKVLLQIVNAKAPDFDVRAEEFKKNAYYLGLEPEDLGRTFTIHYKEYTICGFDPKARKYSIFASCRGHIYKFVVSDVLRALGRPVNPPVSWA